MPEISKPPVHRLNKKEIVWLASNYCQHGHTYLEHYGCYEPKKERVGFLDIEASNLKADFGVILSYCIKEAGAKKIYEGTLTPQDIKKASIGCEDKRLVTQLVADLANFDRIVTYYGKRFDVPYIRSRALMTGVKFPLFGSLIHVDLYFVLRNRFCLSSNRLENACRTLLGKTEKTRIENKFWRGGVRGEKKSLEYILDHNRKDVLDLEKLYNKVIDYARRMDTSI